MAKIAEIFGILGLEYFNTDEDKKWNIQINIKTTFKSRLKKPQSTLSVIR